MSEPAVAAEIEPRGGKEREAARLLGELGFQVFFVGRTISVQAPRTLWETVFGITFEKVTKPPSQQTLPGSATESLKPVGDVVIPEHLQALISNVLFVEPPEFYGS